MRLIICPISRLGDARQMAPTAPILSLLSPGAPERKGAAPEDLRLTFHDITEPRRGLTHPDAAIAATILQFGRQAGAELIIHCYAGVSRSTAAAYIIAADRTGADEAALAAQLRAHSPEATPNALLIALADAALGRKGRMSAAIQALGRGQECFEGRLVDWRLPLVP